MSDLKKKTGGAIGLLYVTFVAWSLYGAVVPVETYLFRMVHMGFIYALSFLAYPTSNKPGWTDWLDRILAVLGAATIAYALIDLDQFIRRSTLPEPADFCFGVLAIFLLVEISRRAVGGGFTWVLAGFLLYVYFGRYIPGPLAHKGYDLDRIVGHMYMTLEGIFGVPLSVSVSFVMLFVVYGTFMDVAGAGNFWLELTDAGSGRSILSRLLREGDEVVLTWKNSLFGLLVTEEFAARGGILALTRVTFADPKGGVPPRARPQELDDLYHTGGPFRVDGLAKPISNVIFRVGEIGQPTIRIGDRSVRLAEEVGFGGAVRLAARRSILWEWVLDRMRAG